MSPQAEEFTECYIFQSTDGITWTKKTGPFPHTEAKIRAEAEERAVKRYQDATRRPDGGYRSYAFLIRCYKPGEEVPETIEENLRRNFGIFW